ncbi:GNAT family N-acetyltransferase [Paenibacillus lautus]|uniref:GNAT family N-acetyltransferase n=1 Tax=Paenibacillus lautus TaxID=1401 RepID=UPI0010E45756|nr:GNAT family N-acetyltransferase [Cytobacillus firmus]VTR19649.1 Acetyltransferase (GNAT) family [Actinobacillus pleuropneumoniae]
MESAAIFSTEQGRFELRRAEAVHAGEMLALLTEAAEVMEQQGRKQWSSSLFSLDLMEQYLAEREVFILWHEDEAAGMFTLQYGDPDYWGKRDDPSYGYLHRLTVRFAYRGLELGNQMISFAESYLSSKGKRGFRLDCVSHLPTLNRFYQRQGFQFVAEQDMGGRIVNLYEKTFVS